MSCFFNPTPSRDSGGGRSGTQINSFDAAVHTQGLSSICKKAHLTIDSFSRMQLTLHATRRAPHGASCLVLAMSAWSVKTRRAPSRHCRDASVYGHTPTAMHDIEYPPLLHASELRSGVSKRTLFSLPRYYGGHLHFSMLFPSSTRVERINAYSV